VHCKGHQAHRLNLPHLQGHSNEFLIDDDLDQIGYPIYLDFDMSESDYLTYERERTKQKSGLARRVDAALSDESEFKHTGTLNFIDNSLDRSSGTIHARATIPNHDLLLTPGVFGRVLLPTTKATSVFLVPDDAVPSE
jgi:hypothetical protein